jgi:HSP20 family protein
MSLVRWSPTRDLATFPSDVLNMQREINKMFNSFFRSGAEEDQSLMATGWYPAVDLVERDSDYVVKMELPGVDKNDVKVTIQNTTITVRGEKKQEKESKDSSYFRLERAYGTFERSFTLPGEVQSEKINASYKDGILTITLPKAETAKRRAIEVKVS